MCPQSESLVISIQVLIYLSPFILPVPYVCIRKKGYFQTLLSGVQTHTFDKLFVEIVVGISLGSFMSQVMG